MSAVRLSQTALPVGRRATVHPAHGIMFFATKMPTDMRNKDMDTTAFTSSQMADAGVAAATDFDWASQMRFYWRGDDETGHLKVGNEKHKRFFWLVLLELLFFV